MARAYCCICWYQSRSDVAVSPGATSSTAALAADRAVEKTETRTVPPGRVIRRSSSEAGDRVFEVVDNKGRDGQVEAGVPERQGGDVGGRGWAGR